MIQKDEFDCDEMYWVEGGLNEEENVVTKIYLPISNRTTRIRAQHELVALEHLTEFTSVPKLLNSNVKTINTGQSNNELWTIMKLIDGERLSDYIKCKKFQLREALKLTRQLLFIVKQIHARKVIHRDIQPKNILVKQRLNNDHIDLMLTSFSSAWINNYQWTYTIQDFNHQLGNTFYRMPQFEQQQNENNDPSQHSSTIDTTGVCAILFWLITGHDPIESQNIRGEAPHQLRENLKLIEKQISAAIGKIISQI
jgi:serine/threonine protein kinase